MNDLVRPVNADLLVLADQKFASDCEAGLKPDIAVSTVSALNGKCDNDELLAVIFRQIALGFLILHIKDNPWIKSIRGERAKLVDEAVVRAAASATLKKVENLAMIQFDTDEVLGIALGQAAVGGRA